MFFLYRITEKGEPMQAWRMMKGRDPEEHRALVNHYLNMNESMAASGGKWEIIEFDLEDGKVIS